MTVGEMIKSNIPDAAARQEGKCIMVEVNGVAEIIITTQFWNSELKKGERG